MGYDEPPHLATVSVRFTTDLYAHIIDGVFAKVSGGHLGNQSQRQLDGYSTPGIIQSIPFPPGAPRFGYYTPAIPVSVSLPFPTWSMASYRPPTIGGAH
jgi:hypothetical protein